MTTLEQNVDHTVRNQEAIVHLIQDLAVSYQKLFSAPPTLDAKLAGFKCVVDSHAKLAHQVVDTQWDFAMRFLDVTTSVTAEAVSAAKEVAKDMQEVAKETAPKKSGTSS